MFLIVALLFLLVFHADIVVAQVNGDEAARPVFKIQPIGDRVVFPYMQLPDNTEYIAHDTEHHVLFLKLRERSALYAVDLQSGEWSDPEYLADDVPLAMGYSQFHKSILFWDADVGRVYQRFDRNQITRIDRSSPHRNQYGHTSWIDQQTGHIYAFGGFGLFLRKNIVTRFSPEQLAWAIEDPLDLYHHPIPAVGGFAVQDSHSRRVFIITHKELNGEGIPDLFTNTSDPARNDGIWEYFQEGRRWTRHHSIDTNSFRGIMRMHQHSFHPSGRFFLIPSYYEHFDLLLYDTNTHRLFSLRKHFPEIKASGVIAARLQWCDRDELFYMMLVSRQDSIEAEIQSHGLDGEDGFDGGKTVDGLDGESSRDEVILVDGLDGENLENGEFGRIATVFQLYRISISDTDTFISQVTTDSDRSPPLYAPGAFLGILTFGLLLIGFIRYRRRKRLTEVQLESNHKPFTTKITICCNNETHKVTVKFSGRTINDFQEIDQKFLFLLANEYKKTDSYVSSELVDDTLWPDYPNPDYIRRVRNLMFTRIERIFSEKIPEIKLPPQENFILRKTSASDKRKYKYRLNPTFFEILHSDDLGIPQPPESTQS
jgi:hypothetical protein